MRTVLGDWERQKSGQPWDSQPLYLPSLASGADLSSGERQTPPHCLHTAKVALPAPNSSWPEQNSPCFQVGTKSIQVNFVLCMGSLVSSYSRWQNFRINLKEGRQGRKMSKLEK